MIQEKSCYAGTCSLRYSDAQAQGQFVDLEGEEFYVIRNLQNMAPFFMSIVSSSDHWMFISSNGALTAGRKNPENALFPYVAVDKIHDSAEVTGAKTIIRLTLKGKSYLWEPFSDRLEGIYRITRNLCKNAAGNKIRFEEINHDLSASFSYQWNNSEKFGFVRKSILTNLAGEPVQADLLDGIQNILPQGVDRMMQTDKSCLVDAYKKGELIADTGLALYLLSSIPVDRAEPSESLKANTAWAYGTGIRQRLLSSVQLERFRRGAPVSEERDVMGKRGAYFVRIETTLPARRSKTWYIAAEINQTAAKVAALNSQISRRSGLGREIETDIEEGTKALVKIVASADGLQKTGDRPSAARHFTNVLFNVMRGGIFEDGYTISAVDLLRFARAASPAIYLENQAWFQKLPATFLHAELLERARSTDNPNLLRICMEYMPLSFGRRHGDPSRPWNLFTIETRGEDGSRLLDFQGNWRDIFQNWEALALSYPGFLESMISKFVNASTADGYNPYRVTREGFDWERLDPRDPWSYIGYWGDHQTIYLLKLLEISERYHPGTLHKLLREGVFSYAHVPYRLKDYHSILTDPYHSIQYCEDLEKQIAARVNERGTEGKLIWNREGKVYLVNLAEKLLVSIFARLSSFVPEGGIWMNTQRPEWNDANNALAGYGLSMVTLCYLRRYVEFCRRLFAAGPSDEIPVSEGVAEIMSRIHEILAEYKPRLSQGFDSCSRRLALDALGGAGESYRNLVYAGGLQEKGSAVPVESLLDFFSTVLDYMDQSIRANRRADGLYHAYNLLSLDKEGGIEISHLYEMLEGQVAVLSSGCLSSEESLEVLEALRKSAMFREDQYSYILYPSRTLLRFVDKNNIPAQYASRSKLFRKLAADDDRSLVEKDLNGTFHFNGAFANKNVLNRALETLASRGYEKLVAPERQMILNLYEEMFQHKIFTGRSGTFFSYEGLGSIYWHMVSKLLLAVEEVVSGAIEKGDKPKTIGRLKDLYLDIRKGLGTYKTPREYGAFPTDPYSHTPSHSGAQQPGMTGQVKEDIITRFRELTLVVSGGKIRFDTGLLNPVEFLKKPAVFKYFDVKGAEKKMLLRSGSLAYTFCQVPVVLQHGRKNTIRLTGVWGTTSLESLELPSELSLSIFDRKGEVQKVEVELNLQARNVSSRRGSVIARRESAAPRY